MLARRRQSTQRYSLLALLRHNHKERERPLEAALLADQRLVNQDQDHACDERERTGVAALSELLRAGIEAGEFRVDMQVETQARMLRATLHGLMVQWHQQPGSVDWHAVAEEFIRGLHPC